MVRAARRGRRAAVLDVARGLRQAPARRARRRRPGGRRGRLRLLPRLAHRVAVVLVRGHAAAGRRRGRPAAQLEQLRRRLAAEGLFAPQKALPRPRLPRCIGVVTGESGKARDDVLAGLRRRGWAGRIVWAFAPVQDRHAAPAVRRALQDLAACPEVEVIVVARGGGSLADLFAFCDETLCRTVALLRVPVISSVGHHTDRTLLDDVAAAACSTPTHAAETAVPVRLRGRPRRARGHAARLHRQGRRAVLERARTLARLSRAPAHHVARHRRRLHQLLRELRATSRRAVAGGERDDARPGGRLARKSAAAAARARHAGAAPRRRAPRSFAPRRRARAPRGRDLDPRCAAARSPRTTRSARSSAATRWSRTRQASRSRAPRQRASSPRSRIRFHDGRVTRLTTSGPICHALTFRVLDGSVRAGARAATCRSSVPRPRRGPSRGRSGGRDRPRRRRRRRRCGRPAAGSRGRPGTASRRRGSGGPRSGRTGRRRRCGSRRRRRAAARRACRRARR